MKPRVDVRLAGESLARLRPPPTSIVDGGLPAHVVRVCCLRAAGVSRLAVDLPVDEATADRFARTCRLEALWDRKVLPSVLVVVALDLVLGIIGAVRYSPLLVLLASLVAACLAIATLLSRSALSLQRSRHHPVLVGRGHVLVRGVDRETARAWAGLNPAGTIEILG